MRNPIENNYNDLSMGTFCVVTFLKYEQNSFKKVIIINAKVDICILVIMAFILWN